MERRDCGGGRGEGDVHGWVGRRRSLRRKRRRRKGGRRARVTAVFRYHRKPLLKKQSGVQGRVRRVERDRREGGGTDTKGG